MSMNRRSFLALFALPFAGKLMPKRPREFTVICVHGGWAMSEAAGLRIRRFSDNTILLKLGECVIDPGFQIIID